RNRHRSLAYAHLRGLGSDFGGGLVAATVRTCVEQFDVRCWGQDRTGIRIPREGSPKEGVMVTITNLFWNTAEARLRAGWRVVVFLIASFVVGVALLRLRALLATLLPAIYGSAVEAIVYLLLIGGILLLASRVLDHRRLIDYGFHLSREWWTDLGFGLALGTLLLLGIL